MTVTSPTPHKHIRGDEMRQPDHIEVTPKGTTKIYLNRIPKEQFDAKVNPVIAQIIRDMQKGEKSK